LRPPEFLALVPVKPSISVGLVFLYLSSPLKGKEPRVYQQQGEGDALQAAAMMEQGKVVELDTPLALSAAKIWLW